MPIVVNLDVMMAKRKISLNELSEKVGLTLANLSILKTGKAKAIRFSTLEAICKGLHCQPADILEFLVFIEGDNKRSIDSIARNKRAQDIGRETDTASIARAGKNRAGNARVGFKILLGCNPDIDNQLLGHQSKDPLCSVA